MSPNQQSLAAWIDAHTRAIEPKAFAALDAEWKANTTGREDDQALSARLQAEYIRHYGSASDFAELKAFRSQGTPEDPLLARQLDRLYRAYLGNQMAPKVIEELVRMQKALEGTFNNFRAELNGTPVTDNRIKDILRDETDNGARRAAWEASKQIGTRTCAGIRELARRRNIEAKRLGFRDYFAMGLELQELDETRLFDTFAKLEQLSDAPFTAWREQLDESLAKRFGVRPSEVGPWHMADPFFQEAPPSDVSLDGYFAEKKLETLAKTHFDGTGMPVDDLLARADLYERDGKCQHAFCMSIDRRDDVRVLCNLKSNEKWMGTLLHELGHAVYDKYCDRGLPFLLREPAHILSTEAIAMLNGRFTHCPEWLEKIVGVPATEARALGVKLRRHLGREFMLLTRWVMVMTHFERDLYADPEGVPDSRWWDYVERFQKLARPAGRNAPDWASKIHLAVAPVYYQNYLLGEMMASQLARHVSGRVLGSADGALGALVNRKEVGEYFVNGLFALGARHPWEVTLEKCTGEGLNPAHFVAEYAG
ncbi:MAG: M3 family oligoendopeptidase [Candidatus Eisenbacteria bacterium]|nr:M3 family oligoendopeptidase [Candidatus Eisenbacteria bacterium]